MFALTDSQSESITGGINGVVLSSLGTKPISPSPAPTASPAPAPAPVSSPGPFALPMGLPGGIDFSSFVPASFTGFSGFPFG